MNLLLWIGIGMIAGGLASRILDDRVEDTIFDIFLGVIGSLFAGFLLYELGSQSRGIDLLQVFTLSLGAVLFILVRNNIKRAH